MGVSVILSVGRSAGNEGAFLVYNSYIISPIETKIGARADIDDGNRFFSGDA